MLLWRRHLSTGVKAFSRRSRQPQYHTPSDFRTEVSALFAQLHAGLAPLVPLNAGFSLRQEDERLTLDMGDKGAYIFSADRGNELVNVQSPVSGVFTYSFEEEGRVWLGTADRHDLRGLVTRDLLRHCVGCPIL